MSEFKNILFIFSFLVYFGATNAKLCTPGLVSNITFTSSNQLQWNAALNPSNCTINQYIINVFDSEEGTKLQFDTSSSVFSFNLPYLDMCKTYSFEVHALTDQGVFGPSVRANGTTPPGANMNLTLSVSNVTLYNNHISLLWNTVSSEVTRCISYYRVVYWDENNSPKDVYVASNNFTLGDNLVPCMNYSFQVSAVVVNPDQEGPLCEVTYSGYKAVTGPPKLVNMLTTNSTVNMTWGLPTYSENRCTLTALVVRTLGLPATSITIHDSALRYNVPVILTNLKANTVYTSFVSLQDVVGFSKNVTVNFQTSDSFVFKYETDLFYDDSDHDY